MLLETFGLTCSTPSCQWLSGIIAVRKSVPLILLFVVKVVHTLRSTHVAIEKAFAELSRAWNCYNVVSWENDKFFFIVLQLSYIMEVYALFFITAWNTLNCVFSYVSCLPWPSQISDFNLCLHLFQNLMTSGTILHQRSGWHIEGTSQQLVRKTNLLCFRFAFTAALH